MYTLKRMCVSGRAALALAVLAAAALAGCVSAPANEASADVVAALSGPADESFARAYEPIDLTFPADHGAHPGYRTEWWYYTGNLEAAGGERYGFQLTFFRSALAPTLPERSSEMATNQVYMAHFAVTDGAAQRHASFERFSRGAGGLAGAVGAPEVAIWLDDWSARQQEPGVMRLQAAAQDDDGPVAIDLLLRQTRPPLLHGDRGLSQKGPEPGNASYYYSLVGLETSGTVTRDGRTVEVTGLSWMDHEFGTSALSENAVGWDWFSLQLDNGVALMLARVRTADGGFLPQFQGTLLLADGSSSAVASDEFELTALGEWTSPRSGAVYPSGWQVSLPRAGIELTVEPLTRDQEMEVSFIYWEGAVTATGSMAGRPVAGAGYVELTGYGEQLGEYQR